MAIKLPNPIWQQPNNSNKFGSLWSTKNINLDKEGFIKLSPRSVSLFNDDSDTTNTGDTSFDIPVAFGRTGEGAFYIATTDEPFNLTIGNSTKTIDEDSSSDNPNLALNSHGTWWQNRFYMSTSTAVSYITGSTWTANVISGLNSAYRHWLTVFKKRNQICVSNGNVVKQYDTSHSNTVDLTLPSDFEVIGMAYNNNKLGIITRLGSDSSGQNQEAYFFWWDGATTQANFASGVGAYTCVGIVAYKSSFVILTSSGELLYFNGGGFDKLGAFPFYFEENRWGDLLNFNSYGDIMVVDGDVIYINVAFDLDRTGKKQEDYLVNNPSGVWCYDPKAGLYHRYSASQSMSYVHNVTQANVNTSTDLFTTSATIPATGNPVLLSNGTVGGLKNNVVYYVIKVSSTTFRLAETKEKAQAGVYLDITSADTNQFFWMYDLVDYGSSYDDITGAVALYSTSSGVYRDVIFGGRYDDESATSRDTLCSTTPFLEGRGYFITPKIYPSQVEDTIQKVFVKFSPLDTNDKIIIKYKKSNYLSIPTSVTTDSDAFIWTGKDEGYTTGDLSEAKALKDAGGHLEIEFISGVGAGQMVQVVEINEDNGIYSFVLADEVVGASSGRKSKFVIDNWEVAQVITNEKNDDGYAEVLIGERSNAYQFKVELRGYETTIEEFEIINETYKRSQ